jgi:hypothetical protein
MKKKGKLMKMKNHAMQKMKIISNTKLFFR